MSSIFFMAVQCCQCSTMQVKQRNKNSKSNKWTCVVCNQKQSILKVFAQAAMARDLRVFVQSFNMSRESQTHRPSPELPPPSPPDSRGPSDRLRRRRSDWTEFLDPDDHVSAASETGDEFEFEPEIATEIPVGVFKKVKVNKRNGDELFKPVLAKRNVSNQTHLQDVSHKGKEAGDEKEMPKPKTCQFGKGKWGDYITRDDSDGSVERLAGGFAGRGDDRSIDMVESFVNEVKDEDEEIHPDFL